MTGELREIFRYQRRPSFGQMCVSENKIDFGELSLKENIASRKDRYESGPGIREGNAYTKRIIQTELTWFVSG